MGIVKLNPYLQQCETAFGYGKPTHKQKVAQYNWTEKSILEELDHVGHTYGQAMQIALFANKFDGQVKAVIAGCMAFDMAGKEEQIKRLAAATVVWTAQADYKPYTQALMKSLGNLQPMPDADCY